MVSELWAEGMEAAVRLGTPNPPFTSAAIGGPLLTRAADGKPQKQITLPTIFPKVYYSERYIVDGSFAKPATIAAAECAIC